MPAVRVTSTGLQYTETGVWTAINFNDGPDETRSWRDDVFDTDGMHDYVTENNKIYFNTPGWYVLTHGNAWGASQAGAGNVGYRQNAFRLNGTDFIAINSDNPSCGGDLVHWVMPLTAQYHFNAGDYIEVMVRHDVGSSYFIHKANQNTPHAAAAIAQRTVSTGIKFVSYTKASGSFTHYASSGDLVIVGIGLFSTRSSAQEVTGVTFNSTAMSTAAKGGNFITASSRRTFAGLWYHKTATTGAVTVAYTLASSSQSHPPIAAALTYAGTTGVATTAVTSTGNSSLLSAALTMSQAKSWIVGVGIAGNTAVPNSTVAGTSTVERAETTATAVSFWMGDAFSNSSGSRTIQSRRSGGAAVGWAMAALEIDSSQSASSLVAALVGPLALVGVGQ